MPHTPKDDGRPVNLADIAEQVGVSMMTVSLALRDSPRISAKTKAKVLAKAEQLGYTRDPEVSRLMAYIRNRRVTKLQANLGFMHCLPEGFNTSTYIWSLYEGCKKQAANMGYSLNTLCLTQKGMTRRRMAEIIDSRNIQGVVMAPIPPELGFQPGERMDPNQIAGVNIGYSVTDPLYSRVTFNHYQAIFSGYGSTAELGYQRIGLALQTVASRRVRDLWLAGFTAWQTVNLRSLRVEPLIVEEDWKDSLHFWLKSQKPDVVLTQTLQTLDTISSLGFKVPQDVGVAFLNANFFKAPCCRYHSKHDP
ncbi:MAG: LacI family transcriptional regulator [Verrucomicrobia bacterium]|nr:LacI family transcriptional regulator [Verrucomicrobiota bacterium]